MIILEYTLLFVLGAVGIGAYLAQKKRRNFNSKYWTYGIAIVLAILFFFRFMSGADAISEVYALESPELQGEFWVFISLVFNWWLYASILLVCMTAIWRNKDFVVIIKFFVLPISVLSIIFSMPISMGIVGKAQYYSFHFRVFLQIFELVLILIYAFIIFWENGRFGCSRKELFSLVYIIPMLLTTMPSYMLEGVFGDSPISSPVKGLNQVHRIVLYLSIIIPIVIYILLRNKPKETIKFCLTYISLGALISFSLRFKFADFLDITAWPFHLCNTAMYIIPICLIFKCDKLFYFTYFINVLGAFIAMMVPNYSSSLNMFSEGIVLFYINHFIAFFMPLLMVELGIYSRPRLKTFIYSIVGFAVYFLFILIINAWFSNFATVDYFFVNSDFVAEKLGEWAENLRDVTWECGIGSLKFRFFPLYQVIFFGVYCLLGLAVWFLYEWMYDGIDMLYAIVGRREKIKLDMLALSNYREERGCSNVKNIKLELIDFSKKYAGSKNYSVRNANLVVNGGEIFGFLGPNGAGKSTIIKSIVGIQPVTEGRIEVCGYDVERESTLARSVIGFVPDHYALYENLTGREYIGYIADIYKVSKEDRDKRIKKYVKIFELENVFDNQMKTYSHGMKQKIAIMSALVHNPKIWILDEPLTGLDPNSIYQVKECMKSHAKAGNVVFFSSHIIDVVERICDRIAIIKKGKIRVCKSIKDIEREDTLENFYLRVISCDKGEIDE